MWEEVVKAYFKDYTINDGDIIPHPCNPKYAWARFDVCWERKCARTSEKTMDICSKMEVNIQKECA